MHLSECVCVYERDAVDRERVEDSLGNKKYEQVERKGYIDHLTDKEIHIQEGGEAVPLVS